MQINKATVISTEDLGRSNVLTVRLANASEDNSVRVNYSSPFYSPPTGESQHSFTGFSFMPQVGAQILICKPDESESWFFLTCIVTPDTLETPDPTKPTLTGAQSNPYTSPSPRPDAYSHNFEPTKHGVSTPQGSELIFSESANEQDYEFFTKLSSMTAKNLTFSEVNDIITLANEHGDGIRISSEAFEGWTGPRSIEARAKHNIAVESSEGSIDVVALGGARELNIQNKGIKTANKIDSNDELPGQIVIESFHNDINIRVISPKGRRVFIDAGEGEGLVQIRSGKGGLEVFTDGSIDFKCSGDFNVNAGGNVNMKGGNIHLNPNFSFGKDKPTKNNDELMQS